MHTLYRLLRRPERWFRYCLRKTFADGRFGGSRGGNVLAIAAVAFVPLLIAIGGAVDIGQIVNTRVALQAVADAAALAATKQTNAYLAASTGSSSSTSGSMQSIAQSAAESAVLSNYQGAGLSSLPSTSVTITQTSAYSASVTVKLNLTQAALFPAFRSAASTTISVTSTATMAEGSRYFQVIFVVDVSNSMGIGGTTSAISELASSSQIQCAFACHDPNGYSKATTSCTAATSSTRSGRHSTTIPCDRRATAKTLGIQLKIDYVNEAVQTFISQLAEYATDSRANFSVGIYTFGTGFTQMLAPTTDMSAAAAAAENIDIEAATNWTPPYSVTNYGYTKTTTALGDVQSSLTNIGDGSSASAMRTYVVFLSDGAEDVYTDNLWNRMVDTAYSSSCTSLKAAGVRLFSIWAPYYPVTDTDGQYETLVAPYNGTGADSMQNTMETCATSSDDYIEAEDGPAIQSAVSTTFSSIIADIGLHLSQ